MVMILMLCSVVTLLATVQIDVALDTGSVQEPEMVLDQKMLVQLVRRVENLEKRDQDQQTQIDSLRGELNTEKVKTARLEGRVSRLQASLGVWLRTDEKVADTAAKTGDDAAMTTDDVVVTTDDVTATQQESHSADGGEAVREDRHSVMSDDVTRAQPSRIRRQSETPVIAFHVTLTAHAFQMGAHQSIPFDHVITNVGNAYNTHLRSFSAPMSGMYVFHTTVQGKDHSETRVSLARKGTSVAMMYIANGNSAGSSDSAMAVLHLSYGDDVAVENMVAGEDIEGDHYSHFSGFLLHSDDGETIFG